MRAEWVEYFGMLGMDVGDTIWYRGTIQGYIRGWFFTKVVVLVEEAMVPKEGVFHKIPRPFLKTMNLSALANVL
jgi:hypothetical protein